MAAARGTLASPSDGMATSALENRDEAIEKACEMVEKLQGVPDTIEIGYSRNLLKSTMEVMIISADSFEVTRSQIEGGLNMIAWALRPWEEERGERVCCWCPRYVDPYFDARSRSF